LKDFQAPRDLPPPIAHFLKEIDMFKHAITSSLVVVLLGLGATIPVAMADMRPDEMLMPSAMPADKNNMVSRKDFIEAAGKMWDKAAAEMNVKDKKMMTMDEFKNYYDRYIKR
jgi:hypothetical protein